MVSHFTLYMEVERRLCVFECVEETGRHSVRGALSTAVPTVAFPQYTENAVAFSRASFLFYILFCLNNAPYFQGRTSNIKGADTASFCTTKTQRCFYSVPLVKDNIFSRRSLKTILPNTENPYKSFENITL